MAKEFLARVVEQARGKGLTSVWSVDFMTDALTSGRRFRMSNIVDDYT